MPLDSIGMYVLFLARVFTGTLIATSLFVTWWARKLDPKKNKNLIDNVNRSFGWLLWASIYLIVLYAFGVV